MPTYEVRVLPNVAILVIGNSNCRHQQLTPTISLSDLHVWLKTFYNPPSVRGIVRLSSSMLL